MTEYLTPATVADALRLLDSGRGQAMIIAGGTDLLPDIRKGKHAPACLIDVTRIPELTQVRVTDDYVEIGAAVTFAMLREHPFLRAHVHALTDAAAAVGATPIQTAATWGGNLVQAMPAADGAIIAAALGAELRVSDSDGARWLPVLETYAGPGQSHIDPTRQLIEAIRFPLPATPWGTAWRRAGRRPSLVLPTLNCAVKLVLDEDAAQIVSATIGMGPVGPCPRRASAAEAYLAGRAPTGEAFAEAARLAGADADPRSSIHRASREYRLAILTTLVEDALTAAAERARSAILERGQR